MEVPKRLVLDTNVIIQHLRGKAKESELIAKLQETSNLATTIINSYELYFEAYKSSNTKINLSAAKGFLQSIEVLEFDDRSAERAAQVMAKLESSGYLVDPRDVFIGTIAVENGYSVLTANGKHFERIPDLLVLDPSDLLSQ